jgi:hypothetical protein
MPQSIPKGLTREHVLAAVAALNAGVEHPFGAPTGYELVHEDRRYAPKAVVGLACRPLLGRPLAPEEFSGGEAPGQANYVLRQLGFVVEAKDLSDPHADRRDWSSEEVGLIVADYFAMLRAELAGEPYNKAEHNRALQPLLDGRSKSSIEFKHQNISAVLAENGQPYIAGYRPARNYQKAILPLAIESSFLTKGVCDTTVDLMDHFPAPTRKRVRRGANIGLGRASCDLLVRAITRASVHEHLTSSIQCIAFTGPPSCDVS